MNKLFIALCVALVATAQASGYSAGSGYQHQADAGEYELQGAGHAADSPSSASAVASANAAESAADYGGAGGYGQNIPYQPANTRGNSVSSSFSYPNNKGEILIHRPAAIIVKRPPTKVVVNHPPLVVKPAPVVLHKPPAVIVRKVFVKHHPRPVKVEPVYVNVVKPPAEKYFVNEKQQASLQAGYSPVRVNAGYAPISSAVGTNAGSYDAAGIENAAASDGYQLLQGNQGLAALANLSGSGGYAQSSNSAVSY